MTDSSPVSDLGTRILSAIAMALVAAAALWLGGEWLIGFVVLIGAGLLWEWWGLVRRALSSAAIRTVWMAFGIAYIGAACVALLTMPSPLRWLAILVVIATDSCAYFAGRAFGKRKIAPKISPSKTWAGLYGGMAGAALVMLAGCLLVITAISALGSKPSTVGYIIAHYPAALLIAALMGAVLAVMAQAGDFFESWMKRSAGVKDSGSLLPGHGGLFDRVDGLLPVAIAFGLFAWMRM